MAVARQYVAWPANLLLLVAWRRAAWDAEYWGAALLTARATYLAAAGVLLKVFVERRADPFPEVGTFVWCASLRC